jgi:glycosyltransferase involved in cell wall biosynthesis
MRVLLSAYACSPLAGSEPGVGWGWLSELSKYHEVWCLFYEHQGQKEALEEAVEALDQRENIHLVPIGAPTFLQQKFYRVRYEFWNYKALRIARELIPDQDIDVVHHVTIAAWWNTGHLWMLGIPFILGPISGGQSTPTACYGFLRWQDKLVEVTRSILFWVAWHFWKRPRKAISKAKIVVVDNYETEVMIHKLCPKSTVVVLPNVALRKLPVLKNKDKEETGAIHLLWSGLLIGRKNFGLLLQALSGLPEDVQWTLRVAGGGKLLEYWKSKVFKLRLEKHIQFLGTVDYNQMSQHYEWAHALVFPSTREGTGTVIIEALAHGVPVVALNIHGARVVLDASCAYLIPVNERQQILSDFQSAIVDLYRSPERRRQMSEAARQKAEQCHLWDMRATVMNRLYENACS